MPTIIWDWNGTLLNDLDLCVSTINQLLKNRNLKTLNSASYKEVFSFPVKDYYEAVGFDFGKEDFSLPAGEFIELYNANVLKCELHSEVKPVLKHYKKQGNRQFVLSAMQQKMLDQTLKHQQIHSFFEATAGLEDHYAVSKIERGEELFKSYNIDKQKTIMIGDTIHDFEVAEKLNIRSVLIANGHQSAERLKSTGAPVLNNLNELLSLDLS